MTSGARAILDSAWRVNPGGAFLYVAGTYGFVINTKGLAAGAYALRFTAGNDPAIHTVQFSVR